MPAVIGTPIARRVVALAATLLVMAAGIAVAFTVTAGQTPMRLSSVPDAPAAGEGIALRQLVIATDPRDVGLATWKTILDRIGSPYDVVYASTQPLNRTSLVRPDGIGRYNAVLLSSSALYVPAEAGAFRSAIDPAGWQALWDYERKFGVRQVALSASPGTTPEDYCLREVAESGTNGRALTVTMTPAGAALFDRLRPDAGIPVTEAYVYRTRLEPGCSAQPVLMIGSDVVGALAPTPDGRERLAITMAMPAATTGTDLFAYGLVRWATKGVFVGEQRNWLAVDVDDWFLPTQRLHPDGTSDSFRLTGPEAMAVADQQEALRTRHPLAGQFTLTMALNGSTLDLTAPRQCDSAGTPDPLTSYTLCLVKRFHWINHTLSHPELNNTTYEVTKAQIEDNIHRADDAGIPMPHDILKTPEYSGLGFFSVGASLPAADHGLAAANPALLRAAHDLGIRYLHGNMSFPSHRPQCVNCGTGVPDVADLLIVPDWPTSISFEAATPGEVTAYYNATYGADGTSPSRIGHDLDYKQVIEAEADLAFEHVTSGSAYVHTLHQGNLHQYAPNSSITFDLLEAVLQRYDRFYSVPVMNPDWPTLVKYVRDRTSHFDGLSAGDDVVWNRQTGTVTCLPAKSGTLFISGLATQGHGSSDAADEAGDLAESYGKDTITRVRLAVGEPVAFTTAPRP